MEDFLDLEQFLHFQGTNKSNFAFKSERFKAILIGIRKSTIWLFQKGTRITYILLINLTILSKFNFSN